MFFFRVYDFVSRFGRLGPEMGPDRPDLARYFVSDPNFPDPGPFRGRNVQQLVGPGLGQAWSRVWPGLGPGSGPGLGPGSGPSMAWPNVRAQGLAQGHGPGLGPRPNHLS